MLVHFEFAKYSTKTASVEAVLCWRHRVRTCGRCSAVDNDASASTLAHLLLGRLDLLVWRQHRQRSATPGQGNVQFPRVQAIGVQHDGVVKLEPLDEDWPT